jgi:hypothetical protein
LDGVTIEWKLSGFSFVNSRGIAGKFRMEALAEGQKSLPFALRQSHQSVTIDILMVYP